MNRTNENSFSHSELISCWMLALSFFCMISCKSSNDSDFIYVQDEGLYLEKVDTLNLTEDIYDVDNHIYTYGKAFIYDYRFFDKNNQEYLVNGYGTELLPLDTIHPYAVTQLSINVLHPSEKTGNLSARNGYNQTIYECNYKLANGEYYPSPGRTGVIENAKNVWMHPFRKNGYFALLQLNPYPFIQAPYEVGNTWERQFKVGGRQFAKWISGKRSINFIQKYEIVAIEDVETALVQLNCYVIDAVGSNDIQDTQLRSYFNEDYGFVRLEYKNIDGSRFELSLKAVNEKS